MIKIIFEISKDFIKENANEDSIIEKIKNSDGKNAIKCMFDMVACSKLQERIEKGETEFVVKPEKIDDRLKHIFENEIGEICILAADSEKEE